MSTQTARPAVSERRYRSEETYYSDYSYNDYQDYTDYQDYKDYQQYYTTTTERARGGGFWGQIEKNNLQTQEIVNDIQEEEKMEVRKGQKGGGRKKNSGHLRYTMLIAETVHGLSDT